MTHVPPPLPPSQPLPNVFYICRYLYFSVLREYFFPTPPPSPPLLPLWAEISSTARMKYTSRSRERTRGMTLFPGLLIWIKLRLSGGIKTFDMPLTSRSFHVNQTVAVYFVKRNLIARNSPSSSSPHSLEAVFFRVKNRRGRGGGLILSIGLDVSNVWKERSFTIWALEFLDSWRDRRAIKEITGEQRNGVLNGVSRRTVDDPLLLAPPSTSFPLIRTEERRKRTRSTIRPREWP